MTLQELELLIKQGEGYNLEFKQSLPSKASDLAEEICAFANTAGGTLLIGVDDKGKIVGVSMDNTSRSRMQNILNCIEPHIELSVTEVAVNEKTVLSLECKAGKEKPYTVSGSIIVRNGPNSEKITSVQRMRDFFQFSDRIFFDEGVCKKFKYPDDFDSNLFKNFLRIVGVSNVLPQDTILTNLQLITNDRYFKNGAVLFFGKEPQKFHEQATTRCLLFKGTNKTTILDDKSFSGNLIQQYNGALAYLFQKLNVNYTIEGSGPRKEVLEIPEEVFKEALLNSLCHRDYYEKGAVTHVEIFDDRVEISNPGGLVNSIAKADFGKKSLSRNPLIFGLFLRMGMVEKVGSGINRMKDEMMKARLPTPIFTLDGFFTAKFYRPINFDKWILNWSGKLNAPLIKMLDALHKNPAITKPELADILGQGKTSIDNHIAQLKSLGILSRHGSRKNGKWVLNPVPLPTN